MKYLMVLVCECIIQKEGYLDKQDKSCCEAGPYEKTKQEKDNYINMSIEGKLWN